MENSHLVPWFLWSPRLVFTSGLNNFSGYLLRLTIRKSFTFNIIWTMLFILGFSRTIKRLWHVWMRLAMALRAETTSPSQRFRVWRSSMAARQWKLKFWVSPVSMWENNMFWLVWLHMTSSLCRTLYLQHLWHNWFHGLHKRRNRLPGQDAQEDCFCKWLPISTPNYVFVTLRFYRLFFNHRTFGVSLLRAFQNIFLHVVLLISKGVSNCHIKALIIC